MAFKIYCTKSLKRINELTACAENEIVFKEKNIRYCKKTRAEEPPENSATEDSSFGVRIQDYFTLVSYNISLINYYNQIFLGNAY